MTQRPPARIEQRATHPPLTPPSLLPLHPTVSFPHLERQQYQQTANLAFLRLPLSLPNYSIYTLDRIAATHTRTRWMQQPPQSSLFRRRTDVSPATAGPGLGGGGGGSGGYPYHPTSAAPDAAAGSSPLYGPGPLTASLPHQQQPGMAQAQEQENEALVRALIADVRQAKQSFTKMGTEVKRQNALLDTVQKAMDGARGALGRVTSRLDKASGAASFSHMWALFVFVILVLMFIYFLLKFRR